jgi:hypothetical protein
MGRRRLCTTGSTAGPRRGFWLTLLDALVDAGAVTKNTAIDSTYVKAQQAGRMRYLLADRIPTSCGARSATLAPFPSSPAGAAASAPSATTRNGYRGRHLIENAFCRLKDFRRAPTSSQASPLPPL